MILLNTNLTAHIWALIKFAHVVYGNSISLNFTEDFQPLTGLTLINDNWCE